jgi:RNA polymerase sigma factor (sigma-70 family)
MPQANLKEILDHFRKIFAIQDGRDLTDGELIRRFQIHRDEAAFTILLQRHGPMVLNVCRRLLRDANAAEDAFQATFTVLVRRAKSIRPHASLGGWLYTVAQRVALKARAQAAMRQDRERRLGQMSRATALDEVTLQELRSVLDEEVARLPEKYRTPLVLCYFQGKTHEQAAKELGWPKRSLTNRVTRAREMLREQLVKRGITLTAAALATALTENSAQAKLTALLTLHTVKAAMSMAAGRSVAGHMSAQAVALAEEAMTEMLWSKGSLVLVVLAVGLAVGGGRLAGFGGQTEKPLPAAVLGAKALHERASAGGQGKVLPLTDLYGDPLPDGAMARLGTAHFRQGNHTTSIAYALGGKVLVSGANGFGAGLCIWDATTGRPLNRLNIPASVQSIALTADGKTSMTDGLVFIDIATGKEIRRLQPTADGKFEAALAPDGRIAAAVQAPGRSKVVLWDTATRQRVRILEGHTGRVNRPAFSPDGKTLATGSQDMTLRLWHVETGKELRQIDIKDSCEAVFAPDGKTLATFSSRGGPQDSGVRVWDVKTGMLVYSLQGAFRPFYSPDGTLLAATNQKTSTIHLWNPETGKEIRHWQVTSLGRSYAFSPDSKIIAAAAGSSIIRWDVATGKEIDPVVGHRAAIDSLRFASDGKTLFSSSKWLEGTFLEWDLASYREQKRESYGHFLRFNATWKGTVADISPDRQTIAILGNAAQDKNGDHTIYLRDLQTGRKFRTLAGHRERVWAVADFSPDGKVLLSRGDDGIRLWSVTTGKQLHHLAIAQAAGCYCAFSPDAQWLAVAAPDKTIRLIAMASGKEIRRWDVPDIYARWPAFSADSTLLASQANDGYLYVWSVDSGKEVAKCGIGYSGPLATPAFSPDCRILAAVNWQMTRSPNQDRLYSYVVDLWEVLSGQKIRSIDMGLSSVQCLAFAPDGRTLASGGEDSAILLWDLTGHQKAGKRLAPPRADLDALWTDLAKDAAQAYQALWTLVLVPEKSTTYLKDRLRPVAPVPAEQIAKLIAELASDRFAARDKAAKTLEELGEAAEGAVRKALESPSNLETRRRLELIIEQLEKAGGPMYQKLRAVAVLEHIGTRESIDVLRGVATAVPHSRVGKAAAMALQRLARRSS